MAGWRLIDLFKRTSDLFRAIQVVCCWFWSSSWPMPSSCEDSRGFPNDYGTSKTSLAYTEREILLSNDAKPSWLSTQSRVARMWVWHRSSEQHVFISASRRRYDSSWQQKAIFSLWFACNLLAKDCNRDHQRNDCHDSISSYKNGEWPQSEPFGWTKCNQCELDEQMICTDTCKTPKAEEGLRRSA